MAVMWAAVRLGLGPVGWAIFLILAVGIGLLALRLAGFRGGYLWFAPVIALLGGGILIFALSLFFNGILGLLLPIVLVFIGSLIAAFVLRIVVGRQKPTEVPYPTLAPHEQEIASGRAKQCPFCFNLIHPQATVCQYCHRDQPV
ncbi:MAG: hypothetical protein M3008_08755 [Chloroflexota bacterium]|nr:hypothetical protein [Chloroflexota bacterium]